MLWFNRVKYQHTADLVPRVLTVTLMLWFNRVKYRHTQLEEKLEERRKEEEKKRQEEEEKERRLEALREQVRHTLMSAAC